MSMYQSVQISILKTNNVPGEFLWTPSLHCLANQAAYTKVGNVYNISLFASGEKLGGAVEIGLNFSRDVKKISSNMKRSGMTIVDTKAVKMFCHEASIVSHMLPEPRIVIL